MKEVTCIVCGKKTIDRSNNGMKKYCSEECKKAYRRMLAGEAVNDCKYNEGVGCDIQRCENCGWNPAVERMRKEALYAAEIQDK